ncbi:spliceosome associated protein [Reticulomyxa filosa]|uniref:Spliceosome associated protein n=1 Tax=Reticulomyxa filosa TaxID=46433 RepID=X6NHZ8_RETFI|nr:spliceosome associated protein [Reticulomyxa filosa]|eukprot:ETO25925.1 spliceosome associated protein [Reticulomyxa filosa]
MFVIDSADIIRLCVVKDELDVMLQHEKMRDKIIPILFCANKKDLVSTAAVTDIESTLQLSALQNPYYVVSTNGKTGEGLKEGLSWMTEMLEKKSSSKTKLNKKEKLKSGKEIFAKKVLYVEKVAKCLVLKKYWYTQTLFGVSLRFALFFLVNMRCARFIIEKYGSESKTVLLN